MDKGIVTLDSTLYMYKYHCICNTQFVCTFNTYISMLNLTDSISGRHHPLRAGVLLFTPVQ